ncbi:c-type cytochrome [Flavobacterium sp.]|jgi:cytochrome c|uniref:c-type cytochrome n=1 Tax=Flavobacterium sp. TaxID=239 RepID=UPI0037C13AB7
MKKIIATSLLVILFSCKNDAAKKNETPSTETHVSEMQKQIELGETLFNGKGNCYACHKPDQKIIGPSLQEMVKIYKAKNGNMYNFLKKDAQPLVDPTQYEVMKTNLSITKAMSDTEVNALVAYIYSHNE